jgi:hypothetical protein
MVGFNAKGPEKTFGICNILTYRFSTQDFHKFEEKFVKQLSLSYKNNI